MISRQIFVIGVNYKTTPIEIREQFNIDLQDYSETLSVIHRMEGVLECALLSTCNRTELHVVTENSLQDSEAIEKKFCAIKGIDLYQVKKYFYVYKGVNAIHHMIKVASGMDSMILGEDQILGQFKKAYEISMKQGSSKSVLNTLSRLAITSSKKIKTRNIYLGKARSVAGQAAQLLSIQFEEELRFKKVLMIGSGEMGQLVAQELHQLGVETILMTKRIMASLEESKEMEGIACYVDYAQRYRYLKECDIIISATSSPHYTITKDVLDDVIGESHRKYVFIDLAVPRDIDSSISDREELLLFNVDDLNQLVAKEIKQVKQMDMEYIQAQIDLHTDEFIRWYQNHSAYSVKRGD